MTNLKIDESMTDHPVNRLIAGYFPELLLSLSLQLLPCNLYVQIAYLAQFLRLPHKEVVLYGPVTTICYVGAH